jgi:hypothetical protein
MTDSVMGTSREPARRFVRWVAGTVVAAAFIASLLAAHIGVTLLVLFWALLLMGPVLAWPLTWGPLLGRGSVAIGVLLVILPVYLRSGSPGETALFIAASVPFFLFSILMLFPQDLVRLVQGLLRR